MIHVARHRAVALLTVDRPDRRNALDADTCAALATAVRAATDDGARAIVLAGAGRHFCAGADLKSIEDETFATHLRDVLDSICEASVPVIAAVQGAALGAGTQLAIACDLRVALPDARFGIPAAKLGLMVDHWTVQRLALLAGHGPARAMLLAAEEVDGDRAHALGLVQRLGALEDAMVWAEHVAELAPLTVAGHKLTLNRLESSLADDVDVLAAFRRAWTSDDLGEGMASFRERRTPRFHGR